MAGHNVLDAENQVAPRESMLVPIADPAASGAEQYRSSSLEALITLASKAVIQSGDDAPAASHVVPGRRTIYFRISDSGIRFYFHDGAAESNWVEFVRQSSGGGGASDFVDLGDTPAALGANGTILGMENGAMAFIEPEASRALPAARVYQFSSAQDDVAHSALVVGTKTTKHVSWSASEIERDGGLGIQVASAVITFNGISNTEDIWAALNAAPKLFVNDAIGDFELRWSVEDGTDPNVELDGYSYTLRNGRVGKVAGETVFDMVAEETRVKLRGKVLENGHIHRLEVSFTPTEIGTAPSWGFKDSLADDASGLWLRAVEAPVEPDASVYEGAWSAAATYAIGKEVSHGGELWRKLLAGGHEEPVRGNRRVMVGAVAQAEVGSIMFAQDASDASVISFNHALDDSTDVGDLDPEELEAAENSQQAGFLSITGYSPVGAAGSVSFRMNGVHPQNYRYAFYLGNEQYRTDEAQFYNHGSASTWRFVLPARATAQVARPPWWSTTNRQLLKSETKAADTSEQIWERVTETADPELPDGGVAGQVLKSTGGRSGAWGDSGVMHGIDALPSPSQAGLVAFVNGRGWFQCKHDSSETVNAVEYVIAQSPDDPHLWGFEVGRFGSVTVNPHGLVRRYTVDDQSGAIVAEVLKAAVLTQGGNPRATLYEYRQSIDDNDLPSNHNLSRAANLDVAARPNYVFYTGAVETYEEPKFVGAEVVGESRSPVFYTDAARKNKVGLNLASLVWAAVEAPGVQMPVYADDAAAPTATTQAVGTTALIDGVLKTVVPPETIPQVGLHIVDVNTAGNIYALPGSTVAAQHVSHGTTVDNYDQFLGWEKWEAQADGSGGTFSVVLRNDIPDVALPNDLVIRAKLYGDTHERTLTIVKREGQGETIDGNEYDLYSIDTADYNSDHDYNGLVERRFAFFTEWNSATDNTAFDFKKRVAIESPSHWSQAGQKWESIAGDIGVNGNSAHGSVPDGDYLNDDGQDNFIELTKDVRQARAVAIKFRHNTDDIDLDYFFIPETPSIDDHEIYNDGTNSNAHKGNYGRVVSTSGFGHSITFGFTLDFRQGLRKGGKQFAPSVPAFALSNDTQNSIRVTDVLAIF